MSSSTGINTQPSIEIRYLPYSQVNELQSYDPNRILAMIHYGAEVTRPDPAYPTVCVPLETLTANDLVEIWESDSSVDSGRSGRIQYSTNGSVTFGALSFLDSDTVNLETQTREAYKEVFEFLGKAGCPHLLRVWNHLSEINQEQDHLERYRSFCKGRFEAFRDFNPAFEQSLPAATAVGSQQSGLCVHFLATAEPGTARTNPRQIDAWAYPERYGPHSPSFSRAMLKKWGDRQHLYIAGTASIVGHETVHKGDIRKQVQETLNNIKALEIQSTAESLWKVYLRHRDDLPVVQQLIEKELEATGRVMYLRADICRADLLVEIEAIFTT